MSDDLVKMARLAQRDERMSTGALYGDLADRIEELEAQQAKTYQALLKVTKIHDEVEVKLAKAIEALKHAKLNMPHPDQMIDDTLAEIEGEEE